MQGLIPCTLRRGKPISKSRRVGTEIIGDYRIDLPSQKLLILRRTLINNTNGKLVIHLLKRNLFGHHLLIDRINGFRSSLDVIIHFLLVQGCFHRFGELFDILELFLLGLFHFAQNRVILFRLGVFKSQVLQLGLDIVQPNSVCQGRIDKERFGGYFLLLVGRHGIHGLHIVQTVGYLDKDDPHIIIKC